MKRNFLLAMVLSFGILIGWDVLVLRPQRAQQGPATLSQAAATSSPESASSPNASVAGGSALPSRERIVEYEVGRHRIAFNVFGASIHQWSLAEKNEWQPLAFPDAGHRSMETFPGVAFEGRRSADDTFVFTGSTPEGLQIEKTFKIARDGFFHTVDVAVRNNAAAPLPVSYRLGWGPGMRSGEEDEKKELSSQRAMAYAPPRLIKLKEDASGAFKWWGVDSHYYLFAVVNPEPVQTSLAVEKSGKQFSAAKQVSVMLEPGAAHTDATRFYLGHKGYRWLASLDQGLERSVNFGVFGSVGKLILQSLYFFEGLFHNYGWAIVALSIAIQILVMPLTIKSFQHGLRMKEIQPHIKKIQERFRSDPKRLNAEMMNLYKRNGLKFMGMEGCLPVLIQMPVFFALYTALSNAYELRHAPWIMWITDLSRHDPYYVLPVLMGAAMLAQQKMTMAVTDPAQARIMYLMPVVFTFFFLKMPAGLVLYWLLNSIVSFVVQLILKRRHPAPVVAA